MSPRLKAHPAADLFPMMSDAELDELAADIKARGQLHPIIITTKNLVLDGRNRLEACRRAGVEPDLLMWDREDDDASPTEWVLSANLHRRHLSSDQRALIAAEALPMLQIEAANRRQRTLKRGSEQAPLAPRGADGEAAPVKGKAAEIAAKATGASTRSVERAKAVMSKAPELVEKVKGGELTLKQAEKKIRHTEQVAAIKAYVPPVGKFQVITTDFSWEYDDKLDGSDAVRGGCPYPPMKVPEIVEFVRGPLAACADEVCLYGCWVTNPIMLDLKTWPPVQQAIEEQGFRPVKLETWRKTEADGGPFTGLGNGVRNDTEQLVLFARGRVVYNELGEAHGRPLQRTCFDAPIGEHSEKPQLAYDRLEQLVPYTSRLEMFSRAERVGWVTSGAEMPKVSNDAVEPPAPSPPPPRASPRGPLPKRKNVQIKNGAAT